MVTKRGSNDRRIPAGEFKPKCLKLMDHVEATGEAIVITTRGIPMAELGPVRSKAGSLLGSLRGRIEILGDILEPFEGVTWEAML